MAQAIRGKVEIRPIMYPYSGQENLIVKKDITYLTVNSIPQTFDVYYPVDAVPSTGVHGFDFINDDDETRNIIDTTIEFIKTGAI